MTVGPDAPARKLPRTACLVCVEGGPAERARARRLAARLGLSLQESPEPMREGRRRRPRDEPWRLAVRPDGLILVSPAGARTAPRFVDGAAATHAREHDLAGQPLARALGIAALSARLQRPIDLLDATAGFGTDAWLASALGARVTLCERDPLIHALLEDALARAAREGDERTRTIAGRLSLLPTHAEQPPWPSTVDLVYLDPMYPERRVRGGQRKRIDALQAIVGHDRDNAGLLDAALRTATVRVIVKRPRGADPLPSVEGHRPNDAISGPNTRYDRYLAIGPMPGP